MAGRVRTPREFWLQSAIFCVLYLFMSSETIPTCARRVFDITEALCRAVGNAIRPGFIQAAMAMMVIRRICRVRGLLLAIEARFLAGVILTSRRKAGVRVVAADIGARACGVDDVRLPRGLAWLCPLVPSYAATYAGHLRMVLAEPEMVALLASCPQAVRAIGPLCRMLGVERADYVPGVTRTAEMVRVVRAKRVRVVPPPLTVAKPHLDFTFVPRRFRLKIM